MVRLEPWEEVEILLTPDSLLGLRKEGSGITEIKGRETEAQASEQEFPFVQTATEAVWPMGCVLFCCISLHSSPIREVNYFLEATLESGKLAPVLP